MARHDISRPCTALLESLAGCPLAPDELAESRLRLKMLSETLRTIASRLELPPNP